MNTKITLLAVVLAIGVTMMVSSVATPVAALPPKRTTTTDEEPINGGITAETTTTTDCANPSGNGPQADNCPNEDFETVVAQECVAKNKAGNEPGGQQKNCPE
jgi:hypothetical protein